MLSNSAMPLAKTKPMATMTRCDATPVMPVFIMHRFDVTFNPACAAVDKHAATNPIVSNVGAFHDAAPMPSAIGTSDARA